MAVPPRRIAYADNPVMAICWTGFVEFCYDSPECVAQFETMTGRRAWWVVRPATSPLEALIDRALTPSPEEQDATLLAFIDWINRELWGEDPFA